GDAPRPRRAGEGFEPPAGQAAAQLVRIGEDLLAQFQPGMGDGTFEIYPQHKGPCSRLDVSACGRMDVTPLATLTFSIEYKPNVRYCQGKNSEFSIWDSGDRLPVPTMF